MLVTQSCLTLYNPMYCSPWNSPGKDTRLGSHSLLYGFFTPRDRTRVSCIANRWGKMERVADFIFLGSKITADGDCSHEIERRLLLGRKAVTNLDSILKSRDLTLPTKIHLVKAMVFPVATYGCESWTIKKAEHQRTEAFQLWRWKRLLRVPWTARRSDQSILKEISPEYSLEGLMLKLKLQYFGHLM